MNGGWIRWLAVLIGIVMYICGFITGSANERIQQRRQSFTPSASLFLFPKSEICQ